MADSEVQKLIIWVGSQAKINQAREQGLIGDDDFTCVTGLPEFALQSEVQAIQVLIPSSATAQNQLADKDFVNSSINNMAAFYVTSDVQGDPFDTRTDLLAGPWYNQGVLRTPTQNDYALVTEDETHDDLTSRYMYDGTQWVWQYTLNNTKFTQAQIDAINSGITSALVSQITTNQNNIGDLSSLTTTAKTSLVSAVNELQSGKQATISDLATIRAGASAGATAVQPSALENYATNTDLQQGLSIKIDKDHAVNDFATNCITEIPQDIKLELNNGTLTLKSGSVITTPDGTQVQTTVDKYTTYNSNGKRYVHYNTSTNNITIGSTMSETCSGTSDSLVGVAWHTWYDTTNNIIKRYSGDGTTVGYTTYSLPIAIITVSNGAISSIDKVFNGAGYIGHHAFVLPGVKTLVPDGFNSDGTLKSYLWENTSLRIIQLVATASVSGFQKMLHCNSSGVYSTTNYKEIDTLGDFDYSASYSVQYIRDKNRCYYYSGSDIQERTLGCIIYYSYNGTSVTKFDIRPVSGLSANYINTALGYTPVPYSGATQTVDLNAQDLKNVDNLAVGTATVDGNEKILSVGQNRFVSNNNNGLFISSTTSQTRKGMYGVPMALEIQFNSNNQAYSYPLGFHDMNANNNGGQFLFTSFSSNIGAATAGDVMVENDKGGLIFNTGNSKSGAKMRFTVGNWQSTPQLTLTANGRTYINQGMILAKFKNIPVIYKI